MRQDSESMETANHDEARSGPAGPGLPAAAVRAVVIRFTMDVDALMQEYRGRLAFWGEVSTQRTMPYGTPEQVRDEVRRLNELGREGGFILSPAHSLEGDVPLSNLLAIVGEAQEQAGASGA